MKKNDLYNVDKDALFARINEMIDSGDVSPENTDFSAFENIPERKISKISYARSFLSAAAAIIILFAALPLLIMGDRNRISDTDPSSSSDTAEAPAAEYEYPEDDVSADEIYFPASKGWEFSHVSVSDAKSYSTDYEEPPAFENNTVSELFSEDKVFSETDFLLDCKVNSAEYDEADGSVIYKVTPVHTVSYEAMTLPAEFEIRSGTAYVLREGHEYLIPVKISADGYESADRSSPQTEITAEGFIIFHNGWKELLYDENIPYLTPQTAPDDYFYDRMNIASESNISYLIDAFGRSKDYGMSV